MTVRSLEAQSSAAAPGTYNDFIAASRRFVEYKGLQWDIPVDEGGAPLPGRDWDLRVLTNSHARNASRTNGFAVDPVIRAACLAANWNLARLPLDAVLDERVQNFIKAVIAFRCREAHEPRVTRHFARIIRKVFSTTNKAPWEIASEDLNRFLQLGHKEVKITDATLWLAKFMNAHLLSVACPLELDTKEAKITSLAKRLGERKNGAKLPEVGALYELARIVFQEAPKTHHDLIRFCTVRLLVLTGLRLNEVLMLPADCLKWESHVDVVTGRPAGEIGGISRTLSLRYFGEKREEGAPDILVEDDQQVPERFQAAVTEAVQLALTATAELRRVLKLQGQSIVPNPGSDFRKFKTTAGVTLEAADLLFLVLRGDGRPLPDVIEPDAAVAPVSQLAIYTGLGISVEVGDLTLFDRYGRSKVNTNAKVKPHSLRHLMNTELFRLNVADTVITNHFGRQSVAQSYEYDHRTLSERLAFVQLPEAAAATVVPGGPADLVAKMVVSGQAGDSHITRSFKRIQEEHGDEVAFAYLAANSDGFHVTPYGYCVNSFSLNPCARHLKCFDECRHFVPSGMAQHRVSLSELRAKLQVMRDAAMKKPARSAGRANQVAHAQRLLAGVDAALLAQPGEAVFPNGSDHSKPLKDLFQ